MESYAFYDTTLDNLIETLDEFGVAAIQVLNRDECEQLKDLAWKEFEDLTNGKIKRSERDIRNLYNLEQMLYKTRKFYNINHSSLNFRFMFQVDSSISYVDLI